MELQGNKVYRHEQNPEEKRFHDECIKQHCHDDMMSAIVFEPNERGTTPSEYLDEKGTRILITAMQWLGSPVGQSFLREMGYEKAPEVPKKVMTDNDRSYVAKRWRRQRRGSFFGWSDIGESRQDNAIKKECKTLGFTLEDFYATDGKFLNRILKR